MWVYGPWGASALVNLTALKLLVSADLNLHSHGWGLLGSGAICFSIGCVCKVSWELAKVNRQLARDRQMLEHLALH